MSARFLSHLLLLYIGRVHGAISGCTVLWEVHPASAQKKSLISDTADFRISHVLGHDETALRGNITFNLVVIYKSSSVLYPTL